MYCLSMHKAGIVFKSISKASNVKTQSLKHSTFPLFMRSQCAHSAFTCTRRYVHAYHSQSAHCAFTKCSSLLTVRLARSLIVQSDIIIFRLMTIQSCTLFVIFSWLHNVRVTPVTPDKLFILHSPCLHFSLYACICTPFVLCVYSPFIGAHQIPSILIFLR